MTIFDFSIINVNSHRLAVVWCLLLFLVSGCSLENEPSVSQLDTIELTSDISSLSLDHFISEKMQINIGYPTGWSIEEGNNIIRLTPQGKSIQHLAETSYEIYAMEPYVDRGNRRLGIPQTATEIAQDIADNFLKVEELESQLSQPIKSVNINGDIGATFSLIYGRSRQMYIIVLRTDKEQAIVFTASGLDNHYKEMQKFLNLIALNTSKIEGE